MKVALVTGAAQGLGLVAATLLSHRDFHVVLTDLQDLDAPLARLRDAGLHVEGLSGDISSESFVQQLAQRIERDHGAADVLVNNAGISHRSAYNTSKHGLIGLTQTLAAEWGGRGVRVNAVCPGWIKTEMDIADQGSGAYSDRDIIDRVPMARFAKPEDVAQAIAFLADGKLSGFINGVSLPVDGGWIADASWESLRTRTRQV